MGKKSTFQQNGCLLFRYKGIKKIRLMGSKLWHADKWIPFVYKYFVLIVKRTFNRRKIKKKKKTRKCRVKIVPLITLSQSFSITINRVLNIKQATGNNQIDFFFSLKVWIPNKQINKTKTYDKSRTRVIHIFFAIFFHWMPFNKRKKPLNFQVA